MTTEHDYDHTMTWTWTLPTAEVLNARVLGSFCGSDERLPGGGLLLVANGSCRRWFAGDDTMAVCLQGGPTTWSGRIVIPARVLHLLALADADAENVRLNLSGPGGVPRSMRVTGPCATFDIPVGHQGGPAFDELFEQADDRVASRTVDVDQLTELVRIARISPFPIDNEQMNPLFWITADHGELGVSIEWPGLGEARYALRSDGRGHQRVAVNPFLLAATLQTCSDEDEVTVSFPDDPTVMRVDAGALSFLIATTKGPADIARDHVEATITKVFGETAAQPDSTGNYNLEAENLVVTARILPGDPLRLHVRSVLLRDVPCTPELLAELNEQNASLGFVRTLWTNGELVATTDVTAETVTENELLAATKNIRFVNDTIRPLVAAIYSGSQPSHRPTDSNS